MRGSRPCRVESVSVVRCVCDGMGERVDGIELDEFIIKT
jgi:hypothetical protein